MDWYATLERPPLTPPDWVFSPVWTMLYLMIAAAVILYYRAPIKAHVRWTTAVLVVHGLCNFSWTFLFFGLHAPALALVDCVLLDLTLVALIIWFGQASRWAGVLLVPYLVWIFFATYLTAGFWILNRGI